MKIKKLHFGCHFQQGTMDKVQTANASMKYFRLAGEVRLKRSAEGPHAYELATAKYRDGKTEIRDIGRGVKCSEEQGDPAGQRFSVSCVKDEL
jgi:hypothetical protein